MFNDIRSRPVVRLSIEVPVSLAKPDSSPTWRLERPSSAAVDSVCEPSEAMPST
jgi:hypothetical protein